MERYLSNRSKFSAVAYDLPAKQGLQRKPTEHGHKFDTTGVAYDLPAKQGLQPEPDVGRVADGVPVAYDLPAKQGLQPSFGIGLNPFPTGCIRPSSKTRTATDVGILDIDFAIPGCIRPSSKTRTATWVIRLARSRSYTVAYDLPAKQGLQRGCACRKGDEGVMLHTTFQQNKDCNSES